VENWGEVAHDEAEKSLFENLLLGKHAVSNFSDVAHEERIITKIKDQTLGLQKYAPYPESFCKNRLNRLIFFYLEMLSSRFAALVNELEGSCAHLALY